MSPLARTDDLEHLLLADTLDLRQGHGETSSLVGALVLDGAAEGLGLGRVGSIKEVAGHGSGGVLVGSGLHVPLLVGFDLLLHLDLLLAPLLLGHLGAQSAELLRIFGCLVASSGLALSCSLFVVCGGGDSIISKSLLSQWLVLRSRRDPHRIFFRGVSSISPYTHSEAVERVSNNL